MIVWNGFGFIGALAIGLIFVIAQSVIDRRFGEGYYSAHQWTNGAAFLFSAIAIWTFSDFLKRWRTSRYEHPNHDSLFFIPLRFWPIILAVLGAIQCARELIK